MSRAAAVLIATIGAVMVAALAVVVAQHERRSLFVELQNELDRGDQLREEWSMLQLELGALTSHSRLERIARSELDMSMPRQEDKVIIKGRD